LGGPAWCAHNDQAILWKFTPCLVLALTFLTASSFAQRHVLPRPLRTGPTSTSATSTAQTRSEYKGIWEPVNYPDDIFLTNVFFVSEKVGWAGGYSGRPNGSGSGGVLIHTNDGGEHWDLQLGDPDSGQFAGFEKIYFLDKRHGWVVQKDKLLRTTDGQNWEEAGSLPPDPLIAYQFSSPNRGVALTGYSTSATGLYLTLDGGRHWRSVWECAVRLIVNGLTQNSGCRLDDVNFVSPRVGYAAGGGDGFVVVAKTEDGGGSWKIIYTSTDDSEATAVFFTDQSRGFMRVTHRKLDATSDGGRTWHGVPTPVGEYGRLLFADPEVGWLCDRRSMAFTSNGGKRWGSSDFHFPEDVYGASLPRRDRAYVVGEHGMVYRYRVVRVDYTAKGILPAPLMPGFDTSRLTAAAGRVQRDIEALQVLIPRTSGGAAAPDSSGGFAQNAGTSATQSLPSSNGSLSASAAPGGDFTQDVDTSPASAPLQECCGPALQNLQSDLTNFNQAVPLTTSQFRPLNLVFAGMQVVTNLFSQTQQLSASFKSLKHAPSLQAASLSLQQLSSAITSAQQTATTGFQDPGAYDVENQPADFTQDTTPPE